MGLTLITGRAGAGAARRAHDRLQSAARMGREAVLIVPGFADVRRARESLAHQIPLGVEVTTFEQWLEALWRRNGDGRQLVSLVLRKSLARESCAHVTAPLDRIADSGGLAELVATIAARSAGLERSMGGGPVMRALGEILGRYERAHGDLGLVEPGEAVRHLADSIALSDATVAWSRFTDLSTIQLRFIQALSRANEVIVALTWAEKFAATEALSATVATLVGMAESHITVSRPLASSELDELERSLYDPQGRLIPTGEVVLSEASGPEAEAVLVARAAARAVADGFEPDRIAVVFRDFAHRRSLVETALRAAGVRFSVDFQVEFASTPLGSALLAITSVVRGAGGRAELLHFLRGPFADAALADVEALDATWRKKREVEPERLLAATARLTPRIARIIQLAKSVCPQPVSSDNLGKWQELSATMLSLASEGGVRHEGDTRLDVAVHGRLVETAAQIVTSGAIVTGDALLVGLARTAVSSGSAERSGAIQVTDAHRIRSRSFDVVILGGLTAAEFSSEKREPVAAMLLGTMGLSPGMDERLAERMLYYLVVTRARHRLELVRQAADASGNPLRPSVFWEETRDLYRTAAEAAAGEEGMLEVAHRLGLSEMEQAAPALSAGRALARADAVQGHLRAPGLSRGEISHVGRLWPANGEFSVTELEQYLGCPYQWFYGRVIRPAEVDRAFDARSRGSYAHAMLAGFYALLHEQGHERITAENISEALLLFDEFAEALPDDPSRKTQGLQEELAAASARAWVRSAVEQDADILESYRPVAHEWAFGIGAGSPFEMGGVPLRGKIDRVDAGPPGLVVTDYKSSAVVQGRSSFEGQRLLQVVVYARAAAAGFGAPPVAGMHRSLRTGAFRGFWNAEGAQPEAFVRAADLVGTEELGDLISQAEAGIVQAVEGIRSGRIDAVPADRRVCAHCAARVFCANGSA